MMEWSKGEIMAEFEGFDPNSRFWSTGVGGLFVSVRFDNEPIDAQKPFLGQIQSSFNQKPVPFMMRRRFSCFERAEAWAIDTAKDLCKGASLPE